MHNSAYKDVITCIKGVYKNEGLSAFYRSYTTQLVMNVPFQVIHFTVYEVMQKFTNPERTYSPIAHMISGMYISVLRNMGIYCITVDLKYISILK